MLHTESISVLHLPSKFSYEELRHNYHLEYLRLYRNKLSAATQEDIREIEDQVREVNLCFCELEGQPLLGELDLQLDFRHNNLPEIPDPALFSDEDMRLEQNIKDLWGNHQHGLALRLLEICINQAKLSERGKHRIHYSPTMKLLGRTMLELGMAEQGTGFATFGLSNYEKAQVYKRISDYKTAAIYLGKSLQTGDAPIPIDEVCQQISICYFLLNDYENALNIIEDILPELIPRRNIFEISCKSKKFATSLMISVTRLSNVSASVFQSTKLRLKYPLSYKYLRNCYGSVANAFKIVEEIEGNPQLFDEFMASLHQDTIFRNVVELDYSIENLGAVYFKIFNNPLEKSLIYHPG